MAAANYNKVRRRDEDHRKRHGMPLLSRLG
jgi:hypothetical protein